MKRLQIQTLREGGLSLRTVSQRAEVSESTVQRVVQEGLVGDPRRTDAEIRARMGRPSKVEPYREQIEGWLKEQPELTSIAILERLREEGYEAGKSAVYEFVKGLRPSPDASVVARFEGLPGEFSQHDFGQVLVTYEDGARERIRFFASRLKYSRRVRIRLVPDETTETICHSLFDAFTFFGGVPLESVFDNPKTIVTRREEERIIWQPTFAQFCAEGGITPRLTWPYSPQQKGAVENLVGFGKSSFFKAHQFRDRQDLEEKLERWHQRTNVERPCRATGEVPEKRWMEELPRFRPLRFGPEGYTLKYSRQVRTDGFAEYSAIRYFVGADAVGQTVTLHVGEEAVEVYQEHRLIASHPRQPINGKYSVLSGQRPEMLKKPGARSYVKRQLLLDLCPAAEWFLTEVRHRRPLIWKEEVDRIFELLEEFGEPRVQSAFAEAGRREVVGAEYLEAILNQHAAVEADQ